MHWLHSVDQIIYRLGAACFTKTEFARILCELREDRKHAMAMTFAESHRSAFRQTVANLSVDDPQESPANVLRAQATLIEDGARHLIMVPAYYAAHLELAAIETILASLNLTIDPYEFHAVQRTESVLALLWKAFVEMRTFGGQISYDTNSEILGRGLTLPDFSQTQTRSQFLAVVSTHTTYSLLDMRDLDAAYDQTLSALKDSPLLVLYTEATKNAENSSAFLGSVPKGITLFGPAKEAKGHCSLLSDKQ